MTTSEGNAHRCPRAAATRHVVRAMMITAALASCSSGAGDTAQSPTATVAGTALRTAVVPATTLITIQPSTTSTTAATTTTPARRRLQLRLDPGRTAEHAIVRVDGEPDRLIDFPFDDRLAAGTVIVRARLDDGTQVEETIELVSDTTRTVYARPAGQLVTKLIEFDVSGAPKQVAFTPDSSELWVTLLNEGGIAIHDPVTGELIDNVALNGDGSVELTFTRDGSTAYVSQMETASVFEIDVASRRIRRQLATESTWTKVVLLSPDEKTLYASNWVDSDVSEIDLETGEVTRKLRTVKTPRGLALSPDGDRLYVAGFGRGEFEVFDLETGESEILLDTGGTIRHLVADRRTDRIFASDMERGTVHVINTLTDDVMLFAEVDNKPNTIDLSPDGRLLFVSNRGKNHPVSYYNPGPEWGSVLVLDTETGRGLDAIVGGNQTTGLDVSPDGTMVAFSDFLDDRVTVYEIPPTERLLAGDGGHFGDHLPLVIK